MRLLCIAFICLLCTACDALQAGGRMPLTVAPTEWVDLEVVNVWLRWSQTGQCSVEVHVTLRNNGNVDAGAFDVTLHDLRETVAGMPAHAETTLIWEIDGQTMMSWMRTTGTIDVDNVIAEADEDNNDYDRPLPYSAVPGMESISYCYMSQTPPSGATFTPTPFSLPTHTPSSTNLKPNLRILGASNTLLPYHCLEAAEGEFIRVGLINDGDGDVGEFNVRIHNQDYAVAGLAAGTTTFLDIPRPFWDDVSFGQAAKIIVDPQNTIDELEELDNEQDLYIMMLTPPPRCTPTPTWTPSATPT